uniref:Transmembrane protein n=1 Tax=Steinernema glaseri TaxID=37863 RepID=A0A1I7YNC5_9BILA
MIAEFPLQIFAKMVFNPARPAFCSPRPLLAAHAITLLLQANSSNVPNVLPTTGLHRKHSDHISEVMKADFVDDQKIATALAQIEALAEAERLGPITWASILFFLIALSAILVILLAF